MKVLLITVGGSDIPVVTSIKSLKPDRVIFFCTSGKIGSRSTIDGEGLVCGDYVNRQRTNLRPNIMKQTGLTKEQTVIVEVDCLLHNRITGNCKIEFLEIAKQNSLLLQK